MTINHGTRADGTPITDLMVEEMTDEAESGYDVDQVLRRRQPGRPAMGSAASSVESVRLDPELKRDLLLRAAETTPAFPRSSVWRYASTCTPADCRRAVTGWGRAVTGMGAERSPVSDP